MEAEHLTTGWEPDVPLSDSLLRRNLANLEAEAAHVARGLGGRVEATERVLLTDAPTPIIYVRRALLRRPLTSPDDVDAVMAEVDRFYGAEPLLLMSLWPTPDLSGRRLSLMGHPPFMVRLPGERPGTDPPGLDVVEVHDEATTTDFERVMVDGYPIPELQPFRPGTVLGPAVGGPLRAWVGYEAGEAVACAYGFVAEGLVQVEDVAALPQARGKGYGEALTWYATLADPSLPAVLMASDLGRPVYERMGYVPLFRFTLWFR